MNIQVWTFLFRYLFLPLECTRSATILHSRHMMYTKDVHKRENESNDQNGRRRRVQGQVPAAHQRDARGWRSGDDHEPGPGGGRPGSRAENG